MNTTPFHKKVKAFTLAEILVVLVLTISVVGTAFSVLNLVQKHMNMIQENQNKRLVLKKLETVLWLDFGRYSEIDFDLENSQLWLRHELDSVSYTFFENYVVRAQDTFQIRLESKKLYFDGRLSDGSVDAIKIKSGKQYQNAELFIYKENDATVYFQ